MDAPFEYVFPAIRGIQARQEYYVSMCPLRLLPKLFLFNEEELVPELRAQRLLNRARLPELARYMAEHPENYVFSAITASIDAEVRFEPIQQQGEAARIGLLHVPMSAKFIINDGQHRRAAIEMALRENPDFGDESIGVVFFMDIGLKRCQQMFADLNRYAIRPSRSLGILYDHRDDRAELARKVATTCSVFRDVVEMERSTLSARSRRLFTFSAIYSATNALLLNTEIETLEDRNQIACSYWQEVGRHIKEWELVRKGKISAGEAREDSIHSHGVVLQALGRVGNSLLLHHDKDWRKRLAGLSALDWSRSNTSLWEGRAMIGGRVSKATNNVILTGNAIKQHLGLALTPDEQRVEDAFARGDYGRE